MMIAKTCLDCITCGVVLLVGGLVPVALLALQREAEKEVQDRWLN